MSDKEKSMETDSDDKKLPNKEKLSGGTSKKEDAKSDGVAEELKKKDTTEETEDITDKNEEGEKKKSKKKHKKHKKKDKKKDKDNEEDAGRQSAYYLKPVHRERTSSALVRKRQAELDAAYAALTPRQKEILERMERGETITPPPATPSVPSEPEQVTITILYMQIGIMAPVLIDRRIRI